jgi:predicted HD phosphohydrolase
VATPDATGSDRVNAGASESVTPAQVVSFTAMEDGTAADYRFLDRLEREHAARLGERILESLERLTDSLGGYRITRLEHSLQCATRARTDGADDDWVVAALVHDIGDELAPYNHAELAAAVLRPYVREEVTWVIEQHAIFQSWYFAHHLGGDRNRRDAFAGHPWAELCADFCARWDQSSFDPDHPIDPLGSFEDQVLSVFGRRAYDPSVVAAGPPRLVG